MYEEKNPYHTMPYQAKVLQLLIENARDYAIMMLDTQGRVVLWNTGAGNLLGWQEDEIIGQPTSLFFTPEDRAADVPEQELRTAREQGRAEDERWHVRKDGSRFWGSGLAFPVIDGELRGYLKIFRDLTEQRRAQEAVRVERERLQATLDAAEVGTWLVQAATNRVIGDTILCGFFGLTEEQAASATAETYLSRIHPDDAPAVAAALQQSMTTGRKFDVTYRVPQGNGAVRWLDVRGQAAFNAEGRFVHLYGVGTDVTARKEAEKALRGSETRFRALADNIAQLAWMADGTGWIFWYNRRWYDYTGTTFEEMQGWGWKGVHHPDYITPVTQRWTEHLSAGREWEDTFPLRSKDGVWRWFLSRAFPIRDESGNVTLWFGTNTDVTEQREIEEALRRHQTEIEGLNVRLARAMQETHHRVKNNLQVIAALVEMQADELGSGSAVQRIKQHVRSLATIHDLLTQQAKRDADTSVVRAGDVLKRLIPMLQATSGDRRIKADIADVPLSVQKATALSLLVSECVSNAIKHAKGIVDITLEVDGGTARLEVCDDGTGFPSEFDPGKAANTGLELIDSTARWDLRGEVHYENQEQGGGRVVVTFPVDMPTEL